MPTDDFKSFCFLLACESEALVLAEHGGGVAARRHGAVPPLIRSEDRPEPLFCALVPARCNFYAWLRHRLRFVLLVPHICHICQPEPAPRPMQQRARAMNPRLPVLRRRASDASSVSVASTVLDTATPEASTELGTEEPPPPVQNRAARSRSRGAVRTRSTGRSCILPVLSPTAHAEAQRHAGAPAIPPTAVRPRSPGSAMPVSAAAQHGARSPPLPVATPRVGGQQPAHPSAICGQFEEVTGGDELGGGGDELGGEWRVNGSCTIAP